MYGRMITYEQHALYNHDTVKQSDTSMVIDRKI